MFIAIPRFTSLLPKIGVVFWRIRETCAPNPTFMPFHRHIPFFCGALRTLWSVLEYLSQSIQTALIRFRRIKTTRSALQFEVVLSSEGHISQLRQGQMSQMSCFDLIRCRSPMGAQTVAEKRTIRTEWTHCG